MKRSIIVSIILAFCFALFSNCSFINEGNKLGETSIQFFDKLSSKDYNGCVSLMALESDLAEGTNIDTLKYNFERCENLLISNFGEGYKYKLMSVKFRSVSFNGSESTENSRFALIQVSNDKIFGVCKVLFDEKIDKILLFYLPNEVYAIPDQTLFWLLSFVAIAIVTFIVLTIRRIYKSNIKHKWLFYILTIVLNVPTLAYSPLNGFAFKPLYFQLFMGVSFWFGAYSKILWSFALPLGALISRYKIYYSSNNNDLTETDELLQESNGNELIIPPIQYSVHTYKTNVGTITIEQELQNPNVGENIFLDGIPAPSDNYKIGFMSYVNVDNGVIVGFSASKTNGVSSDEKSDNEASISDENNEITPFNFKMHTYKSPDGIITIDQELQNPNIGERIFLDGKPAFSGKYKIGFMSYVEVEDGMIVGFSMT